MDGIAPSQDGTGVFQNGVLKSAARPKERALIFASLFYGAQRAIGIAIGTGRYTPDSVISSYAPLIEDFFGWHPVKIDAAFQNS